MRLAIGNKGVSNNIRETILCYSDEVIRSFKPNEEYTAPRLDRSRAYKEMGYVNLRKVPNNTTVYIKGSHSYSKYVLRVNSMGTGRIVGIWKDTLRLLGELENGFYGPVEKIVSLRRISAGLIVFEEGVIRKGCQTPWPYFECELSGTGHQVFSVIPPQEVWTDTTRVIMVQEPQAL